MQARWGVEKKENTMVTPHSPGDRIPDTVATDKATNPVFPLKNHICDRQGVPTLHSGEWDYADNYDI